MKIYKGEEKEGTQEKQGRIENNPIKPIIVAQMHKKVDDEARFNEGDQHRNGEGERAHTDNRYLDRKIRQEEESEKNSYVCLYR